MVRSAFTKVRKSRDAYRQAYYVVLLMNVIRGKDHKRPT